MKKVIKHMKIILLQEVENLGKVGEIKEVRPGYASNFLIPKGYAVFLNDPKAKELFKKASEKQKESAKEKQIHEQKIQALSGKKIIFKVKINPKGKPYRAIHAQEIAEKLGISASLIDIEKIDKIGEHELTVKSGQDKSKISVVVKAEK